MLSMLTLLTLLTLLQNISILSTLATLVILTMFATPGKGVWRGAEEYGVGYGERDMAGKVWGAYS